MTGGVVRPELSFWQRLTTRFGVRYVRINHPKGWRDCWLIHRVVHHAGQDYAVVKMSQVTTEVFDTLTGGWKEIDRWTEWRALAPMESEWEWLVGGPQ